MTRTTVINILKTRNIQDLNRFNNEAIILIPKIVFVLKSNDDELRFSLSETLTVDENSLLDSFIIDFTDSDPEQRLPLIIDLAKAEAKNKHFHNIIYTSNKELSQAMIPEREKGTVKGEVLQVIWYKELDFTDPSNPTPIIPVIKVDIAYTRDATGFATSRVTTRTYYNRDGSENSETKITIKYYFVNKQDMVDEGIKRRTLLVKSIQIPTMNLIAEVLMPLGVTLNNVVSKGRQFMDDYRLDFSKFIENSSSITDPLSDDFEMKTTIVKLRDEDDAGHVEWLDKLPNSLGGSTSIRNYLIAEFDI
jgi:hypothetical protein